MKKRKSRNDIRKEVLLLINSSNSQRDLVSKIEVYLNNLTGKELVNRFQVELIIKQELLKDNKFKISDSKNLKKVLNIDKIKIPKKFTFNFDRDKLKREIVIDNIIFTCSKYEKIINENPDKDVQFIVESDKVLTKLIVFLKSNPDVSELLCEFIYEIPEKTILDKIKVRKLPISAITIFFNNNYDIKENTNIFYRKLEKKIPQTEIQQAIIKWLNNIKKG